MAAGLSTYRWNNNIKSMLLLAAFPFLLLLLFGIFVYLLGWIYADPAGRIGLGASPVTGWMLGVTV